MSATAEQFRRAGELFQAAAKLDPHAREAFLIDHSNGDSELMSQVRALLCADELPEGVLDLPALGDTVSIVAVETAMRSSNGIPARIGRYRIIRVIGEGGMGVVYEAEQDEPRRSVALKVIRPGMVSASLLRRFRHEAHMLGKLKHPGIAQIYDAGTADQGDGGQPYFAMELVTGRALLDYVQACRLGTRQRLELVARICDAVHHAHLNGVIHRDLKPVNIVVDESSRLSEPKILDFGIARAIEADIQTVTLQTDVGRIMGTIAYMSPEQAAGDAATLDARSDVYALGVIAYELLAGRLPYEVHGKLIHEAVRVIREDEPSRLSSISRVFRGDVETIIAKALEKEKERRYQSAAEFAADLRRYLAEQPIAARPTSRLYQLRKFARRNKAIVTGVAVAFAALAIGTAVSLRQAIIAERARIEEHRLRNEAERQSYRASLVAASAALRYHETSDAQRQLDAAPERLRGWEWDHLYSRLDDSLIDVNIHSGASCIAVSPDGRLLAIGNHSGRVWTLQIPEMTPVADYRITGSVQGRRIARIHFSTDGRELRVDTPLGSHRLDAQTLNTIASDSTAVRVRSPDGRFGAAGKTRLAIIEIATGREVFHLDCQDALESIIEFSHDGELVAICLRNQTGFAIYRTSDGHAIFRRPDLNDLWRIAFCSDGSRAAIARINGEASILDAHTGSELVLLRGHNASVSGIVYSPDETLIATSSGDHTVRLWQASDGSPRAVMHGNQSGVNDMKFLPDGSMFTTACADGNVRLWDAKSSDPFVLKTDGTVYGLAFSSDGKQVFSASLGGERPLRAWNTDSRSEALASGTGALSALALNASGTHLAIGRSGTQPTSILDFNGGEVSTLGGHWWRTNWLAFSNHDRELVSLGNGGRLLVHDVANGELMRRKDFPSEDVGEGCRASLSPDGSLLAVASRQRIWLLDAVSWEVRGEMQADKGNIYALAFSPDGARLVSGSTDHHLRVWDLQQLKLMTTLHGHSAEVYAVVFHPDGTRFFSGGRDRVIRVWDAQRFEEVTQLHGHTSLIYCLAFSPDGKTLASGGGDATVRFWDAKSYRQVAAGR